MSSNYDILVINDRMLDAQETLIALEQIAPRATVLHLESGGDALEYLFSKGLFAGRPPLMPRLVLLSAEMCDLSAATLVRSMRAHPLTRTVPIVVLSLQIDSSERRRRAEIAADVLLARPLDFQRYCAVLRTCVRCWMPSALRRGDSRPRSASATGN